MPDIDTPTNLTNRCFHCGETFVEFSSLQAHLEKHKGGSLRPSGPINFVD
jgi:hypothetical protein